MDFKAGRLAADIQRVISQKMRDLKDPRIEAERLTIVHCEVTRDRSVAKIYVSSLDGMEAAKRAVKGFESASGLLRHEIVYVLGIRKAPELRFIPDDSAEYSAHISQVLKGLDIPKDAEEPEDPEDTEEPEDPEDAEELEDLENVEEPEDSEDDEEPEEPEGNTNESEGE